MSSPGDLTAYVKGLLHAAPKVREAVMEAVAVSASEVRVPGVEVSARPGVVTVRQVSGQASAARTADALTDLAVRRATASSLHALGVDG